MCQIINIPLQNSTNKKRWDGLPRKCVVKVVLSKEQKDILIEMARRLGTSESEMLRTAFMDYAIELSMVKERLHREKQFDLNLK